jgi:protocatechuate 3,4-dioxygenase beta subunit
VKSEAQHIEEPTNEELRVLTRRSALRLLGGAGLALIAGCTTEEQGAATTSLATTTSTGPATTTTAVPKSTTTAVPSSTTFGNAGTCVLIPEETAGPFPLDLSESEQFFRSDITEGKEGVPMTLTMAIVDVNADCAPLSGARVDLWHCDALGAYSGFRQQGIDTTNETFCRGIQLADASGQVSFQTIFPGWYEGRITHVHFQVFLESGLVATSQLRSPRR